MSVSEYRRPHLRRGTPRPFSPSSESDDTFQTFSESSKSSTKQPAVPDEQRHRRRVVSGWLCIPRSVVMATTLNQQHVIRLEEGSLTTMRDVIQEKQRRMEAVRARNRSRLSKSRACLGRERRVQTQIPKKDFYENLLEENLTKIKSLVQKFGPLMRERYKIVPAMKSDEDYEEATDLRDETRPRAIKVTSNAERALPEWKHGFIPASTDLIQYKQEHMLEKSEVEEQSTRKSRSHARPFTADSSLRSQSDKASEARMFRPATSATTESSNARKTEVERLRFSWQKNPQLRNLLPGYPRRVVRNRPHVDHMTLKEDDRPVMTPSTTWFPLSFHGDVRGRLVTLQSDMYGYQSMAEYKELCKSLDDGMAVIEQAINVGDSVEAKVVATDYRKDLLYVAVNDVLGPTDPGPHQTVPCNRLDKGESHDQRCSGWTFSDEIRDVKANDQLSFTFDALGRIKCSINSGCPIVVLQLKSGQPRHLAIILGLGVTKVQLLGGRRCRADLTKPDNAYEIVPGIRSKPDQPSPYFDYNPINDECSFCANDQVSARGDSMASLSASGRAVKSQRLDCDHFSVPYPCDHIKVCRKCHSRVECQLCRAPLCWHSCPLCDTRLQTI